MNHIDEMSLSHSVTTIEAQPGVWIAGGHLLRYEVVGEAYNPQQMQRVAASVQNRIDAVMAAWLVPEPQNLHDQHAVVVWVLGGKVGYLPRELAVRWKPVLDRLRARYGVNVACQANLDPPSVANQGGFGVVVWLPPIIEQPAAVSQRLPVAPPVPKAPPEPRSAAPVVKIAAAALQPQVPVSEELAATITALKAAKLELASVEEALDIQSFGFYQPRYGFESSAQYVLRLKAIKDEQQAMIKADTAAPCDAKWTVGGSAAEGKRMIKQQAKLMLRAFNGECDAAIAKVRYDNVEKLEQRLKKAFDEVNKLGEVQRVFVAAPYYQLKLAELYLVHEHREKVQEEKDEQKRIREQMREEQKAEEEIAKAKADAEKEEIQSAAALEKARAELAAVDATSKQHEKLESLVNRLETELKDALDRKAKAIARAQLTKSGHIYVLSNVGSFGDGVYKIGMTRRLDPLERVDELGAASVPFPFDVHAIIYCEDAPGLENKLHRAFASRRVNGVNLRKEYFRVTLDEIQAEVKKLHGLVSFTLSAEAEEYRKSVAAAESVKPMASDVVNGQPS